jgi:hypothetical protein
MADDMQTHVAKTICRAAATDLLERDGCGICYENGGECSMWPNFMREADHAIKAVREYAMITPRKKPRLNR